jgi:tetratricopeptide (TPR) repeat protein
MPHGDRGRLGRARHRPSLVDCGQVEEAVRIDRTAMAARHAAGDRVVLLSNLGRSLLSRFLCNGRAEDLEEATRTARAAFTAVSSSDPAYPAVCADLAACLWYGYQRKGQARAADLAEAVGLQEQVVAMTPPGTANQARALAQLGALRFSHYNERGDQAELDQVIEVYERAVAAAPAGSPAHGEARSALATALVVRYGHGHPADLDRALELFAALERSGALTDTGPLGVQLRTNLAQALLNRHELTGRKEDLEHALALREVPQERPAGTPGHATELRTRAMARMVRYRAGGRREALDAAITDHRAALEELPAGSADHAVLCGGLAECLLARFEFTDHRPDLDAAVSYARRGMGASGPYLALALGRLGQLLRTRHQNDPEPRDDDLDQSVELLRQALAATPAASSNRGATVHELAETVLYRHHRTGRPGDLPDAIDLFREALAALPPDSGRRPSVHSGLGDAFTVRFVARGKPDDLAAANQAYRTACRQGLDASIHVTAETAAAWGASALLRQDWPAVAEAYGYALEARQRLTRIQLLRQTKDQTLRRLDPSAAARAAYALAKLGAAEDAALTLERGRALVLSERLDRDHAELRRLRSEGRGDLYERYRQAADALAELERAQYTADPVDDRPVAAAPPTAGQGAAFRERLQAARAQLDDVLDEIRAVPGYAGFLEGPVYADVERGAAVQPLAYLAAMEFGGMVLIVDPRRPQPVTVRWLPLLNSQSVARRLAEFQAGRRATDSRAWPEALDRILGWSWRAVMEPLLDALRPARAATLIPTGALSLLPLHAARTRDPGAPTGWRYALDQVAFSYAPNARAATVARQAAEAATGELDLLAVQDPQPVQARRLRACASEVTAVAAQFERSCVLRHERATHGAVLAGLPRYRVHHFSCHGRADAAVPLDSALLLAGDRPLTLRDILSQQLPGTRLVVLSACETAVADQGLPDELVSFPAGLLQAGAGGVVGSLWQVPDASTMALMARFYQLWRRNGLAPAEALRQAQRWLRDSGNGDKRSAFPHLAELAPRRPLAGAAASLWARAREHDDPVHWAAFTHLGT